MFDILADSHEFARKTELLLDGFEGGNLAGCAIGAEEVPGVESCKVLEGSKEFVSSDGGCDELEIMVHCGVVGKGIGDHRDGLCIG